MSIEISINNWDEYNPRKDLKSMPWFRIQSDIGSSESLFGLKPECKWLFIFLLSHAAKKLTGDFCLEPNYITHYSGVQQSDILKYLKQLETNGLVRITNESDRITNGSVPKRREEKRREEHTHTSCAPDLEAVYQKYPLKKGKSRGMKKIQREIKTPDDFERFSKAVDNYANDVKNTEPRYIKHFSTFVSEWTDWVDHKSNSVLDRALEFLGQGEIHD